MKSKNYICERCGGLAKIVHHKKHITPMNINDFNITLNWDNLQALCLECHNSVHGIGGATVDGIAFDENGDLKYEFEWGERPYVFMGYVRRDFDRKTVIVGAKTYTKYVGDYYVAFEPENKRFVPIYPITDEAWELYGHTMLEGNKILAANPKYVKVIDIPSRKVLAKYEPEETIYSATFLTKNKGAIFTNRGVYEFTF